MTKKKSETPEVTNEFSAADAFAGSDPVAQENTDSQVGVEEDLEARPGKKTAAVVPADPALDLPVTITAEHNLRVVTEPDQNVFHLNAGEPRVLPKRLGLAAQLAGAREGVIVTITAAE